MGSKTEDLSQNSLQFRKLKEKYLCVSNYCQFLSNSFLRSNLIILENLSWLTEYILTFDRCLHVFKKVSFFCRKN